MAGAWRELVDLGRDLGIGPTAAASGGGPTRRELAAHAEAHGLPSARTVAHAADAAIFGPADPDGETAARVWALVEGDTGAARWAPLSRRRGVPGSR